VTVASKAQLRALLEGHEPVVGVVIPEALMVSDDHPRPPLGDAAAVGPLLAVELRGPFRADRMRVYVLGSVYPSNIPPVPAAFTPVIGDLEFAWTENMGLLLPVRDSDFAVRCQELYNP
jgi:hypothetical protein